MSQPTATQFASDPRANDIRTTCLNIVHIIEGKEKPEHHSQLVKSRQHLLDMGIAPNINAGQPETFYAEPVNMAEYVAGQLLDCLNEDFKMDFILFHAVRNSVYRFLDAKPATS